VAQDPDTGGLCTRAEVIGKSHIFEHACDPQRNVFASQHYAGTYGSGWRHPYDGRAERRVSPGLDLGAQSRLLTIDQRLDGVGFDLAIMAIDIVRVSSSAQCFRSVTEILIQGPLVLGPRLCKQRIPQKNAWRATMDLRVPYLAHMGRKRPLWLEIVPMTRTCGCTAGNLTTYWQMKTSEIKVTVL
jgi:hypothetical protein